MPASRRASPSEWVHAEIDEAFSSGRKLGQVLEEVARLGVRLLFQFHLGGTDHRRRGHPGGGAGRAGRALEVDREPDLSGPGRPVPGLAAAGLAEYELGYLFADATFFKYHPTVKGKPILITPGITTEGTKVFIELNRRRRRAPRPLASHFTDLRQRGLRPPLLGVTDGNPQLISAFEQVFSESLRQRCGVHVARHVLEEVSKPDQEEVKRDYGAILNGIEAPPAEEAIAIAQQRAHQFTSGTPATPRRSTACSPT